MNTCMNPIIKSATTVAYPLPHRDQNGKDYARHAALDNVMANPDYAIPAAYVFQNDNLRVDGKVAYLPMYMLMFLEKEEPAAQFYKLDLSGLG